MFGWPAGRRVRFCRWQPPITSAIGRTWPPFALVAGLSRIGSVAAADGLFEVVGFCGYSRPQLSARLVDDFRFSNQLLTYASVNPLTQQVGVTAVAGVLVDHFEQHLAQRDRRFPLANATAILAGDVKTG